MADKKDILGHPSVEDLSSDDKSNVLRVQQLFDDQKDSRPTAEKPSESPVEAHMRKWRESRRKALEGDSYPVGTDSENFGALDALNQLYKGGK